MFEAIVFKFKDKTVIAVLVYNYPNLFLVPFSTKQSTSNTPPAWTTVKSSKRGVRYFLQND